MKTVDTNILLRILVDDATDRKQLERVRELALTLEQLYIPQIVQVELVWILKKTFTKEQIVFTLETLLKNSAYELEKRNIFITALSYYQESNVGFSDCIILAQAEEKAALPLLTFDKKLGKLTNTQLV